MEGTIKPVLAAWQHWMAGDQVEYFYLELVKGKHNYYYANALNEREEKCVLENFIFRNEHTRFIGHLDGEHGALFSLTSEREDKIKLELHSIGVGGPCDSSVSPSPNWTF